MAKDKTSVKKEVTGDFFFLAGKSSSFVKNIYRWVLYVLATLLLITAGVFFFLQFSVRKKIKSEAVVESV